MVRNQRLPRAETVQNRWLLASLVSYLICASACAPSLPVLPPLPGTTNGASIPGKFVWIDLLSKDVEAAKAFYGDLFGWTFTGEGRYTQILHQGVPIAGIVEEPGRRSEWVGNLSVTDVDASVEKLRQLGGKLMAGPRDAPDRGRIALVRDPEDALFLLIESQRGDPADGDLKVGGWFWREIWARDPSAAKKFYTAIAGYEVEEVDGRESAYAVFKAGGRLRAGIVEAPAEVSPQWLPYVRVEDPGATADRAASLGARIARRDERSAIVVDPGGAAFAIQVWTGTSDKSVEEAR